MDDKQTVLVELKVKFPQQAIRHDVFVAAVSLVIVAELFLLSYQLLDIFLR
jgi:hypothetical protein